MMDKSKIKEFLPDSELSEIRPCTTPGKVQFHLTVGGSEDPTAKRLDVRKLAGLLEDAGGFTDIKHSEDLGVARARSGGAEISVLASGRAVVRKAEDEEEAGRMLEKLAPLLKDSLF